jgi:hypothetical protein
MKMGIKLEGPQSSTKASPGEVGSHPMGKLLGSGGWKGQHGYDHLSLDDLRGKIEGRAFPESNERSQIDVAERQSLSAGRNCSCGVR